MTLDGIVLRAQSGFFLVRTSEGEELTCRMRGRLKKERVRSDLAVLGDRVRVERTGGRDGVLVEVLPRRTSLSRTHPGSRGAKIVEDVLVANLDRMLAVFAASVPPMNARLVDRFLVVAEHAGIEPVLVINKIDTAEIDEVRGRAAIYERLGYEVLYTSASTGEGIAALRARLAEGISALVGPSGVGKSSLANAIDPALGIAVGETSDALQKGKHTTRVAELHALGGGAYLADTPGIRELAAFAIPERELASCFPDLRAHAECAFGDCLHVSEPECGVRAALARGDIDAARYDSYLRQLRGEDGRA